MGSAPVSQSLMQAMQRALPKAAVTNAYGTTEAGPVVFGPHPKGLPQPEMSVGYPHPQVQLRLVDGDNRDADRGRAGDEVPGGDERLSQPARTCRRRSPRTASTSPAMCSAATTTAFTISSAAPTTCSSPAARTSIPPTSSACWSAIPTSRRRRWCRSRTTSRAPKPVAFVIPKAGHDAERGRGQAIRARQRAGLPASALRLVRRRTAARLDQQGRPQPVDADGGRASERSASSADILT